MHVEAWGQSLDDNSFGLVTLRRNANFLLFLDVNRLGGRYEWIGHPDTDIVYTERNPIEVEIDHDIGVTITAIDTENRVFTVSSPDFVPVYV